MKKTMLLITSLITSGTVLAQNGYSVDEMKDVLKYSGIRDIDWYNKGDTAFADFKNEKESVKASLSVGRGMLEIQLSSDAPFDIYGAISCQKLTKMIPHEETSGWSSPPTNDEKKIRAVFDMDMKQNSTNEGQLNGWQMKIQRSQNTVICSVMKKS
ncbi:hypothetical protein [Vibrio spartinae]|uniref:Uncharacterized protein n=1 Tax=Vibrio spartinae TaxID=1918945 RepID=A0A1N6M604_9VIBR|nr:hypothetical protein [Vibrio spartinae]SIO94810.1 hypothetical protein VSP9026_02540 [Vibrio spartinae]